MSSAKTTKQAAQLAPQVALSHQSPHSFLLELERLILAGYRLDEGQMIALHPLCCIATLRLPEATA